MLTFLFTVAVFGQDQDAYDPKRNDVTLSKNDSNSVDFGFYSGYGWNSQSCSQCYEDAWTGGWLVGMKLGMHYPKKFAIGIIAQWWMVGSDVWKYTPDLEYKRNSIFVHLAGYYYPLHKPDFFLKGSAGINIFNYTPSEPVIWDNGQQTMGKLSNVGPGFSFGLGYILRISKKVDLTPAIDYMYHPFSRLKGEGPNQYVSGTHGSHNVYISLGLNSHFFDNDP
jgi:hypothetical protein